MYKKSINSELYLPLLKLYCVVLKLCYHVKKKKKNNSNKTISIYDKITIRKMIIFLAQGSQIKKKKKKRKRFHI